MKSKSFNLKIGAIGLSLALATGIAAIPAVTASANSAQKDWYGSSTSGMFVADENCPVVVESETLTFDINTFPHNYYYGQEDFAGYDAKVTAHYNFHNPADYDVNMTLAFPFGEYPSYLGDHLDENAKYAVTADGEKVESSIRHTLSVGTFNAEKDVAKILNDYRDDEFFKYDTPVHYYKCGFMRSGSVNALYLNTPYDAEKTAVFYGVQSSYEDAPYSIYRHEKGEYPLTSVQRGTELYLFVVGEDFEENPQFSYGQSFPLFGNNILTEADVYIYKQKDITFKDLMLAYRGTNSSVSETDWYNAAMDYIDTFGYLHYSMSNCFMRWYEYELAVPAGGRVQNEVTAPLYPDINGNYSPRLYRYEYLLSPAKCWASFGTLDIVINTPYYLVKNSYASKFGFEKTESGYTAHLEGLPDGELVFSMSEAESVIKSGDRLFDAEDVPYLKAILIIFGVPMALQIVAAIPLIIVFAVTGKFSTKPKSKEL
ncbi:MAG: hypothetical protein K2N22_07255 [Clostridia bacterium]|nr:hypothetical protein [Clostridia bacterium]